MTVSRKQPEAAAHQAALHRIAVKGRRALKAEGMTDAEIDAAIDELVGKLTPEKPPIEPRPQRGASRLR